VSNRRRLTPPASVRRYADAYRCSDCRATVGSPTLDGMGVWHVPIRHDETCPVLTGQVDPFGDVLAAAVRTAESSLGVVYVGGPR
jgi:hypothetical protein